MKTSRLLFPRLRRPHTARGCLLGGALISSLLAGGAVLRAADVTWTNGTGNFLWNTTSANWSTGLWNNTALDGAIFGATGVGTVSVAVPINVRSLNFTTAGYTLTGSNALNFTTAGTSTVAGATINVDASAATIAAPIASSFGLNVRGAGTLTISNSANSFSGLVALGGSGTAVNLLVGSATSTLGGGNLTLANAAALPASTVLGIGSGVVDLGAANPTLAGLIFAGTRGQNTSTGRLTSTTGTLTVTGEIQVVGNIAGFGNLIAANLNLAAGTQMVRVGSGSNFNRELVFEKVISGSGGLLKTYFVNTSGATSLGGFTLLGNNIYTGPTTISGSASNIVTGTNASTALTVSGGTLTLQGASGSFAAASTVSLTPGGVLFLSNTEGISAQNGLISAVSAANLSNRLSTSAALSLAGGSFQITGANGMASNQQVASLTANGGFNTLTLNPGTGGSSIFSATGNLNLNAGSTMLFRAPTLPLTTATTQGTTAFTFAGTRPTPVGSAGLIVGAIGDTSLLGNGSGFVRYNATGNAGIALLAPAEYTANFTTAGANVDVTGAQTVAAPITVNAIRTGAFTTTLNAPVTVSTGMILATGAATFSGTSALNFGSNRAFFLGGGNVTVNTPLTGSGGLTKSSGNTLTLTGSTSGLSGGIVVQGGTLDFASNSAATAFAGTLDILQGSASFSIADSGSGTVNLGSAAAPGQTAVAAATLRINNAAVTTFARNLNVLGNGGAQSDGLILATLTSGTQNVSGAISLGNNLTIAGGGASSVLNLTGPITGSSGLYVTYINGTVNLTNSGNNFNGDLFVTGTSTVNLAGSVNAGSGGTSQSNGTIRVAAGNNLGSGAIKLRGGTLQADAALTLNQAFFIGGNHTIATGANDVVLSGAFDGATGVITKTGAGGLTFTGTGNFAGGITLATGAGAVTINGGGNLAKLGPVTLGQGTTFHVNNAAVNLANRVGSTTNLTFNTAGVTGGATVNFTTNAATDSFSLGTLSLTGGTSANPQTSTLNVIDGGAGNHTFTFLGLSISAPNNVLNVVGTTNLGKNTAGGSRIFFVTAPASTAGLVTGVTFTGFGGAAVPAEYDAVRGLAAIVYTPGSAINNLGSTGPGSPTATDADFLTNAATSASLGATIKSLTVAGHTVTLTPGFYPPQTGNANAPANTLVLAGGYLRTTTAASTITSGSAARLQFGPTGTLAAGIDAVLDLFVGPNVTPVTTGGLVKTGAGRLTIAGTNQISGDYNLADGSLVLPATGTSAASLTAVAGTTLDLGGGALALSSNAGVSTIFAGSLLGVAGSNLTLSAGNTNTLSLTSGTNTFTGAVTINGGSLIAGSTSALGNAANPVTVGSGATLGFSGGVSYANANPVNVSGGGDSGRSGAIDNISGTNSFAGPLALAVGSSIGVTAGNLTLSGGLSAAGGVTFNPTGNSTLSLTGPPLNFGNNLLTKTGTGTLVLPNGSNTLGAIVAVGGFVQGSSEASFGVSPSATLSPIILNGGGLRLGAAFDFNAARTINLASNGGSFDTNGFPSTLATVLGGSGGSFTKAGAGILTLAAAQTYAGTTTIAGGTLRLGAANALPTTALTIGTPANGSATLDLNGFNQTLPGLTIFAPNSDITQISTGTGTLTLNGNLTLLDNTTVPGFSNGVSTIAGAAGGGLDLGGAIRTFTVAGQVFEADLTISASITNGGLVFNGLNSSTRPGAVSTTRLAAGNSYTLGTTVAQGVVSTGVTGALPVGGSVVLGTASSAISGAVNLLGFSQKIGPLSLAAGNTGGAGNVIGNTSGTVATLTIESATDATFGGSIGGSIVLVDAGGALLGPTAANNLGLVKQGTGTQTLTGTSTFAGGTNVNAGTLALGPGGNLSGGGAVDVASGATVAIRPGVTAATNVLAGNLTFNAGASFTMADGATSTLTLGGGLSFFGGAGSSNLSFDLGGAVTATDQILASGPVAFGSGNSGNITINAIGSTALAANSYTLLSAGPGVSPLSSVFSLVNRRVAVGGTAYGLALGGSSSTLTLEVSGPFGPAVAYWTGDQSATWDTNNAGNTNWSPNLSGVPDLGTVPGGLTDVFFTARGAANLTNSPNTPQQVINSLTFTSGSGVVTINGGGSIGLNGANADRLGLVVEGGSAPRTINTALTTFGGVQNWVNRGSFGVTALTVSGAISGLNLSQIVFSGSGNTTITGALGSNLSSLVKNDFGTLALANAGNVFTGGLTINGGVVSIAADGNLGNPNNGVTLSGGTLRFTSAVALGSPRVVSVSGTGSGLDLNAGITQVLGAGQLTGNGSLTVSATSAPNGGILSIEGANAGFTGSLRLGSPGYLVGHLFSPRGFSSFNGTTLRLQNTGTLPNLTGLTFNNSSALNITQPATAVTGRIGAVPLTFHSGRLQYIASDNGGVAINETFGPVTVTGQFSIAGSTSAGPAAGTTLNFGNLTRNDRATLLFRAPQNGVAGTIGGPAATTSVRYFFANLTPDTTTSGSTRSVIPWAGNATTIASTDPQNFMTYDANGFRPLNTSTEIVAPAVNGLASVASGVNIRTSTSQTIASGGQTINSYSSTTTTSLTGSATATAPGDILTVTSGAMSTFNTFTFSNATVNFPNGGYLHLGFPFAITANSRLTGANGLVATSLEGGNSYALRFTNTPTGGNSFTGGLYANGHATITFTLNNQLGNNGSGLAAGDLVLGGGQLIYNPAAAATVSLSDGASARAIRVNESNGALGSAVAGAVLQIPGTISGPGQVQFGSSVLALANAAGVVELTNLSGNNYSGGTLVSTGILRLNASNQLGTGPIFLNGGTIQTAAPITFFGAPILISSSTIDTAGNNVILSGGVNGSGGLTGLLATGLVLTKNGAGTLTVAGDSNFAGQVFTNAGKLLLSGRLSGVSALATLTGATIELGAADNIYDLADVTLTGSTFATAGFSETLGRLSLGTGVSTIDLGAGASLFRFDNSSAQTWNGTLSITNWSGSTAGGGTDQLYFGNSSSGLLSSQVAQITFLNPAGFAPGSYAARILATGELTAVPEPASAALLLGSLGPLLLRRRRAP